MKKQKTFFLKDRTIMLEHIVQIQKVLNNNYVCLKILYQGIPNPEFIIFETGTAEYRNKKTIEERDIAFSQISALLKKL